MGFLEKKRNENLIKIEENSIYPILRYEWYEKSKLICCARSGRRVGQDWERVTESVLSGVWIDVDGKERLIKLLNDKAVNFVIGENDYSYEDEINDEKMGNYLLIGFCLLIGLIFLIVY